VRVCVVFVCVCISSVVEGLPKPPILGINMMLNFDKLDKLYEVFHHTDITLHIITAATCICVCVLLIRVACVCCVCVCVCTYVCYIEITIIQKGLFDAAH